MSQAPIRSAIPPRACSASPSRWWRCSVGITSPCTAAAAARAGGVGGATAGRLVRSVGGQGWRVPGSLPGGLPLYVAAWAKTTSGEVVDLEYSDGLYVVSLFVERGSLAANMAGWRQVDV